MGSKVSELVKKVGEVGTEMNHGDRDVVCPRMLVRKIQGTAMDGGCGPLWLSSSSWRTRGIESVSGRTWEGCQVPRGD